MLLIRLFSRTFVTDKRDNGNNYNTIVIKEIPKYLKNGEIIEIDSESYIDTNNLNKENKNSLKLKLVKLIKNKIDIVRSKRRKRCTRRIGYKQHIGYFQVIV